MATVYKSSKELKKSEDIKNYLKYSLDLTSKSDEIFLDDIVDFIFQSTSLLKFDSGDKDVLLTDLIRKIKIDSNKLNYYPTIYIYIANYIYSFTGVEIGLSSNLIDKFIEYSIDNSSEIKVIGSRNSKRDIELVLSFFTKKYEDFDFVKYAPILESYNSKKGLSSIQLDLHHKEVLLTCIASFIKEYIIKDRYEDDIKIKPENVTIKIITDFYKNTKYSGSFFGLKVLLGEDLTSDRIKIVDKLIEKIVKETYKELK